MCEALDVAYIQGLEKSLDNQGCPWYDEYSPFEMAAEQRHVSPLPLIPDRVAGRPPRFFRRVVAKSGEPVLDGRLVQT